MNVTHSVGERRHDFQKRQDLDLLRHPDLAAPDPLDRALHALMGQATQGISPNSLALAWCDWMLHLSQSPGKWQQLAEKAWKKDLRWLGYAWRAALHLPLEPCIEPLPQDRRFRSPEWQQWPYNVMQQAFLLNQQWWHNATTGIDGVSRHHEDVLSFVARQLLDLASPVNFVATNPEVGKTTMAEYGANFARGAINLAEDAACMLEDRPPAGSEAFRPGVEVALTRGEVVYSNHLIELIQYAPSTATVHAEPVLIVPAWIMKYYILDLSPHNSLVRYLVHQGHTVFIISWHNPGREDSELGMDDYLEQGVMQAIAEVQGRIADQKINAIGYCLGGTLLAIAVAAMACEKDSPINSMTLLAAQVDFTEAGELMLYIDESQIAWLEDLMWQQGYLDNRQMAGAFRLLRTNDLIWSLAVNQYLLGKRAPMTDLMAWNADSTRMPRQMHGDYLRKLFLDNELFSGRYKVRGRPIALSDIRVPLFAVATMTDHVSPWRSVHKIHLLAGCEIDFVLTSGGHNAGIVSEPGHRGRHYYLARRARGDCYVDPDRWIEGAQQHDGSWWPVLHQWLERAGSGAQVPARAISGALYPAPGRFVLEK